MSGPTNREWMRRSAMRHPSSARHSRRLKNRSQSIHRFISIPARWVRHLANRLARSCRIVIEQNRQELSIELGSRCVAGVRPGTNQDRCYADSHRCLLVVADGVGGHVGGECASQTVIEVIASQLGGVLNEEILSTRRVGKVIRDTLALANRELMGLAQRNPSLVGMSSTATVGVVRDGRLFICHVGDSRAYLYRHGRLSQLTSDDTLVQGLVATDTLTMREARRHPMRQLLMHSLGTWPLQKELKVDSFELEPGDRLLFTTDGLTDIVSKHNLQRLIGRYPDPQEAADHMVEIAENSGFGGNVTCIVANLDAI